MKSRKFKLRPAPAYFVCPNAKHKWKIRGLNSFILNYHAGEKFNQWVPHGGTNLKDLRGRPDWTELTGDGFKAQFPLMPL
jgi:hypothetical protein